MGLIGCQLMTVYICPIYSITTVNKNYTNRLVELIV